MRLLRLAIEQQRWDLAAHTIVLAAARAAKTTRSAGNEKGEKADAGRRRGKDQEKKEAKG